MEDPEPSDEKCYNDFVKTQVTVNVHLKCMFQGFSLDSWFGYEIYNTATSTSIAE